MKEDFKKYLVEFIGTFFLVFTVGVTVSCSASAIIPAIAIGLILMVMVYAGGYISGGHYNPSVTLSATMRGALPVEQLIPYWISQGLGGIVAAILIFLLINPAHITQCPYSLKHLMVGEFLFTFALCYVVLLTTTAKKLEGNQFYGLAIGSTLAVGAFIGGGVLCFGAFNPAVALAFGLLGTACWNCVAVTIATNTIAAIVASFVFKLTNIEPVEEKPAEEDEFNQRLR